MFRRSCEAEIACEGGLAKLAVARADAVSIECKRGGRPNTEEDEEPQAGNNTGVQLSKDTDLWSIHLNSSLRVNRMADTHVCWSILFGDVESMLINFQATIVLKLNLALLIRTWH